jgi:hypothetical protein
MKCENTKTRAKRLIDQPFLLRMENQVEQLRFVLVACRRCWTDTP